MLVLSAVKGDLAVVQSVEEAGTKRLGVGVHSVVFVAALDEERLRALGCHRLVKRDYRLLHAELHVAQHVLQLADADVQVELSCTCNDELSCVLVGVHLDQRVGLEKCQRNRPWHHSFRRETYLAEHLQLVSKLLGVLRSLGFDSLPDNRSHGEGHVLQRSSFRIGHEGAGLDEVFVDPRERHCAASWYRLNAVLLATHHHRDSTQLLVEEAVVLRSQGRVVVGAQNLDHCSRPSCATEDTTESSEVGCLVVFWNHLRDEDRQWAILFYVRLRGVG